MLRLAWPRLEMIESHERALQATTWIKLQALGNLHDFIGYNMIQMAREINHANLVFEFAVGVRILLSPPSSSERFGGISADGVRSQIDGTTWGHRPGFNRSSRLEKFSWIQSCNRIFPTFSNMFQRCAKFS